MPLNAKQITVLLSLALFLNACGGSAEPTQDINAQMTAAVGTMVASFFQTQTAVYTPPSLTFTPSSTPYPSPTRQPVTGLSSPTNTFVFYSPTLGTVTVTGTLLTATINPNSLAVGCNNLAFIRDVTLPAGTVVQPNQDLTKTWKVQNTGSCNWLYQYSLVPLGDTFGAANTKIQRLVTPGDWSELSIYITAPKKAGTYTSYWRLSNGQSMFGATLTVSFVVASPTSTSAPSTNTPVPPTSTTAPSDTPVPSTDTATATP